MKLNIIAGLFLALFLSAGISSNAGAQEWRWHNWGKCGYSLCKEDTMGMSKRGGDCHFNSCCYHHGWGLGWGWHSRWCGRCYYYESLHKGGNHECARDKEGDKEYHKDGKKACTHDGHHYYHHWSCCGDDRYYYRGGGY